MARKEQVLGRINHNEHDHPQTSHFKRLCREQMIQTGEPLVAIYEDVAAEEADQAAALDEVLDRTEDADLAYTGDDEASDQPPRNSHGRFTRDTLAEWTALLDSLDGVQDYLVTEGAGLVEATLTTRLGGHTFVAVFNIETGWTVTVGD